MFELDEVQEKKGGIRTGYVCSIFSFVELVRCFMNFN